MFQDHMELDITPSSYRDIRNEHLELENLVNQSLKDLKLEKKRSVADSLEMCLVYLQD
jgi:hypothetical protein